MDSRSLTLILISWVGLTLACFGGQDIQSRFEESLTDAKGLSGVEINWLDTYTIIDPAQLKAMGVSAFSRTFDYSYVESGSKFRAMCELVSGTQTNLMKLSESAFDGKLYSTYDGNNHSVTKSSVVAPGDNSESPENPLIAPFMFLTKHSDDCLECMLRFRDITSDEFAKGIALPTGKGSNGLVEISMPGLTFGNQPTAWEIGLDEAGDSFAPKEITFIAPGIRREIIYRLLDYTNLETYQFPGRIEWAMSSYPPTFPQTMFSTGSVTVTSARIPGQVADSVFRLKSEEESAVSVWDWDQKTLIETPTK